MSDDFTASEMDVGSEIEYLGPEEVSNTTDQLFSPEFRSLYTTMMFYEDTAAKVVVDGQDRAQGVVDWLAKAVATLRQAVDRALHTPNAFNPLVGAPLSRTSTREEQKYLHEAQLVLRDMASRLQTLHEQRESVATASMRTAATAEIIAAAKDALLSTANSAIGLVTSGTHDQSVSGNLDLEDDIDSPLDLRCVVEQFADDVRRKIGDIIRDLSSVVPVTHETILDMTMAAGGDGVVAERAAPPRVWHDTREALVAKLLELAKRIRRDCVVTGWRDQIARIQEWHQRRDEEFKRRKLNNAMEATAPSPVEETDRCLLTVEGLRHCIADWLGPLDRKELQLVCFETCRIVRRFTPVAMHASMLTGRYSFELRWLVISHTEPCKESCQRDEHSIEVDGSCSMCRMGACAEVWKKVNTPRWVWSRQSGAFHKHCRRRRQQEFENFAKSSRILAFSRHSNPILWVSPPKSSRDPPPSWSRVPPLLVTHMTWSRGLRDLDRGRALPPQLQSLTLGYYFNHSLDEFSWPVTLRELTLGYTFNRSVDDVDWPVGLEAITFGDHFRKSVDGVRWPAGLRRITFGCCFNRPITEVSWPDKLHRLEFGKRFNQPLARARFPSGVEELRFGDCFNQPLSEIALPKGLRRLEFGQRFNQPVVGASFPAGLEELQFGDRFNQPISDVEFPVGLKRFHVGCMFNQDVRGVRWPDGLLRIDFGLRFNNPIAGIAWPPALVEVKFGAFFDHPIHCVTWPAGLKRLTFGRHFAQAIDKVAWPAALEELTVGPLCHNSNGAEVLGPPWLKTLAVIPALFTA